MKKVIFYSITLVLPFLNISANNKSENTQSLFHKNEIYLNINSAIKKVVSFSNDPIYLDLIYKRSITEKINFRTNLYGSFARNTDLNIYSHLESDSTSFNRDIQTNDYNFALGFEGKRTKKRTTYFWGIDVFLNKNYNKIRIYNLVKPPDYSFLKDSIVEKKITTGVGAYPFLGIRYAISEHFSLACEFGPKIAVESVRREKNVNDNITKTKDRYNYISAYLKSNALLNFFLAYSF